MNKLEMDELIDDIDEAAKLEDFYNYGLPETDREKLYKAIQKWIDKYFGENK